MFRCIALVDMWWHKLISTIIICDSLAEGDTGLIVHDVCVRSLPGEFEAGVNGLIGSYEVSILFSGEELDKDGIAAMQFNHEVLVTTTGVQMDMTCVICVQVGKRYVKQGKSW